MLAVITVVKSFLNCLLLRNFGSSCCRCSSLASLRRFALYELALTLDLRCKTLKRRR